MNQNQRFIFQTILAFSTLILISIACSVTQSNLPKITNHTKPEVIQNHQPFEDVGCPLENGFQRCSPGSTLSELGCQMIRPTNHLVGALQPNHPIHICLTRTLPSEQKLAANDYIYSAGCLQKQYIRYVIWKDDHFELIQSKAEFQSIYAPIETSEEALSYAIGITGLDALYDLEVRKTLRYFIDTIEDTHVKQTQEGYLVYLFDYKLCGCGPHSTYLVEILVKPDGVWNELNRTKIFEDPEEDNLCVD